MIKCIESNNLGLGIYKLPTYYGFNLTMRKRNEITEGIKYQKIKKKLEELKKDPESQIFFIDHALEQMEWRNINRGMVIFCLKNPNTLRIVDKQEKQRYKLWFKLSSRYSLILIVRFKRKNIYVITVIKTNRKWQKQTKKSVRRM